MPPPSWPRKGKIEWERMGLRYRKSLPAALKDVTCTSKTARRLVCVAGPARARAR